MGRGTLANASRIFILSEMSVLAEFLILRLYGHVEYTAFLIHCISFRRQAIAIMLILVYVQVPLWK